MCNNVYRCEPCRWVRLSKHIGCAQFCNHTCVLVLTDTTHCGETCKISWAQLCTVHIQWGLQLHILRRLKVLPLKSQYIRSLLIIIVNDRDQFLIISEIHNINTRHSLNLHLPLENLDIYHKGTIQVFRILIVSLSTLKYLYLPLIRGHLKCFKTFLIHDLILFIK